MPFGTGRFLNLQRVHFGNSPRRTDNAQAVSGDGKNMTMSDVPVVFPHVGPCPLSIDAELEKVERSRSNAFARIPDDRPKPPSVSFVHPDHQLVHSPR